MECDHVIICMHYFDYMQATLKSEDHGKHLLGVQDLIQKHTLMEADITTQTERAKTLKAQMQKFLDEKHTDAAKIVAKISELDSACQRMESLSKARLSRLQESLKVQEFYLQVEEEEAWIREKEPMAASMDYGKDINSVMKLQQKHQSLEAEIQGLSTRDYDVVFREKLDHSWKPCSEYAPTIDLWDSKVSLALSERGFARDATAAQGLWGL